VGQIDHVHHPEHQRKPAGEQREQAPEQDPLDESVDDVHVTGLRVTGLRVTGPRPGRRRRPVPLSRPFAPGHAEIGRFYLFEVEFGGHPGEGLAPFQQALKAAGRLQCLADVLFNEQHPQSRCHQFG
jgi:hypothetical protein